MLARARWFGPIAAERRRSGSKLPPRMTTSRAFTPPNSVASAVSLAVAVVACFVLFAVTDRNVSPIFADPRERDDNKGVLAVNLGDSSERTGEATLSGAARRVPPAPHIGATLRRDLPDVGSDDGPPGGRTGRAESRARCARGRRRCAQPRARALGHRRRNSALGADEAEDRRHQTSAIFVQGARSSTASG